MAALAATCHSSISTSASLKSPSTLTSSTHQSSTQKSIPMKSTSLSLKAQSPPSMTKPKLKKSVPTQNFSSPWAIAPSPQTCPPCATPSAPRPSSIAPILRTQASSNRFQPSLFLSCSRSSAPFTNSSKSTYTYPVAHPQPTLSTKR